MSLITKAERCQVRETDIKQSGTLPRDRKEQLQIMFLLEREHPYGNVNFKYREARGILMLKHHKKVDERSVKRSEKGSLSVNS